MRSLEELKTLTDEERRMLRELKEAVLRFAPDAQIILYGSTARGERQPDSDYDVLVLLPEKLPWQVEQQLRYAVYEVGFEHETVISVFVHTREQWASPVMMGSPYYEDVEREGLVV